MASHCLSVFTQEELAEQARSVFASRARAVPPPARSAPLPAWQSPDHLCRMGSPHPGCPRGGEHYATSSAPAPPEGIPRDPPFLICTKAASLLTSACVTCGAPENPGEGELPEGRRWDTADTGAAPQVAPHPAMGGGAACRAGVIQRPLHKISPISRTGGSPLLQVCRRRRR